MVPRTPLVTPIAYFARDDRPSARLAVGYVVATMVTAVASVLFISRQTGEIPTAALWNGQVLYRLVVEFSLVVFPGWVLVSVLIHVPIWFTGPDGAFLETMIVVGESHVTMIVLIVVLVASSLLPVALLDPAVIAAGVTASSGMSLLVGGLKLVETIWAAVIQTSGLVFVHDVPAEKAGIVTLGVGLVLFVL